MKISLKAARTNAGLTQKEAADSLGVSNKTVGKWEKGESFPGANVIPKICDLYGASYDDIIFLPTSSL